MTLPNFLIIGAQKCGTSWLRHMLRQHPDVYMPREEIHFFDKGYNYARGLKWYENHFREAAEESAIGEKTPDYLWAEGEGAEDHLPDVHLNIRATLPEARLVVMLRDPAERAVSAVGHLIQTGRISPLKSVDGLLNGKRADHVTSHGVIEKGYYRRQLDAYLELFPRDQLLILIFEEAVLGEKRSALRRLCEFLGVDPDFRFKGTERRVGLVKKSRLSLALDYYLPALEWLSRRIDSRLDPWKPQPEPATLNRLQTMYAQENERLFELLGRRISSWNDA